MTFTVLALMVLQRRLGMSGQLIASQAMGGVKLSEINEMTKKIILMTVIVQSVCWFCLTALWWEDMGAKSAMYHAFFYTVSAYNNAGFALTGEGLMPYAHQPAVILTICALIMIGGMGFFIIADIVRLPFDKEKQPLRINTRIILSVTLSITAISAVIFWLLEHKNVHTLGLMPLGDQIVNAIFSAVTPRTAGFNTVPIEQYSDAGTFLMLVLMFIGASSFSTGGGIKVGTMIVLILTTWAYMRQRDSVTVMQRRIPDRIVRKSISVVIATTIMILVSIFVLLAIEEHHDFIDVLFEVVSAISTVGLSRGITGSLTPTGEAVLMFMMFAGRVGPLTVGYLIATPKTTKIQYPETTIDVG